MTEDYRMWKYWRDEKASYSIAEVLKDYYPEIIKHNEELRIAIGNIKIAELAIDKIMSDLADEMDREE